MKKQLIRFVARLTTIATIVSSMMSFSPASAATFSSSKDTMTRLAISTTADHTVVFTLPAGVTLDASTNVDTLRVDFPAAFTAAGTWVVGDFTFNDGTARTVTAVAQGAGTIDCTAGGGTNDVCVAYDSTNNIFTVEVGAAYTASAAAATITFTIDGTTTDGTLTNPGTAGTQSIGLAMCDETAGCPGTFVSSHSSTVQVPIVDSDQVTVSASVDAALTFDIDTSVADAETVAPYSVALGSITTASVRVSGATDSINMIILEADTNAGGGMVVTVRNANGTNGLVSTSTPASNINSATAAMAAGTENYGLCVATAALTGFSRAGGYAAGSCALNTETNNVIALSTTDATMLSTAGPMAGGHAEVVVNGAISATTNAHSDYADTLTFIATSTF